MSTVFVYSGQGSQYYQMGKGLFTDHPVFREHMQRMDRALAQRQGLSVLGTLYAPERSKSDSFDATVPSTLSIFMLEYALTALLAEHGIRPDIVVGASLGGFTAACVAGAVDPDAMLDALCRQSGLLEQTCPKGAMLAVLADPDIHTRWSELGERSEIVTVNAGSLFVIALLRHALEAVENRLARDKIAFQRMPVALPYHTRWIDPWEDAVRQSLNQLRISSASLPVELCLEPEQLLSADAFWKCVRQPIRWLEAIERLERSGPHLYIDTGPSGTMANLLRLALPSESRSRVCPILSPLGNDTANLRKLLTTVN